MKVMISYPTVGKTPEEIEEIVSTATRELQGRGYEVLEEHWNAETVVIGPEIIHEDIYLLSERIALMSQADAVYFCDRYAADKRCMVEHRVASSYKLDMLYER